MNRTLPTIAIVLLAGLTVLSGALHGRLTQRWGVPRDASQAAEALRGIPAEFGEWRLEEKSELSEAVRNTLQCEDYLSNTYVHTSGQRINVAVLLGPPGPIAVHTPEICYSSREYELTDQRELHHVQNQNADGEFWLTSLRSRSLDAHELNVYYAWSDGGPWTASESPRYEYAGGSYLFKLQLAALGPADDSSAADLGAQFLNDFVPVWQEAVASLESTR